jgi:hypothetical protein
MAWIEQTKKASIKSGGPQYYLQGLSDHVQQSLAHFLRRPVRLWTPYGIVESGLTAVSSEVGSVEHDRVQSGRKVPSIANQLANWYSLNWNDIETITFDDSFDSDSHIVIKPRDVKFRGKARRKPVFPDENPLTVIRGRHGSLLVEHLHRMKEDHKWCFPWATEQLESIVAEHKTESKNVHEFDLLRASGALDKLGIHLGMYHGKEIDCPFAAFKLCEYPQYKCPIEVESASSGFLDPHHAKHRRQRVVVLCMAHNAPQTLAGYVDIIELQELAKLLRDVA